MLGTIISAVLGGGGGFLGSSLVLNLGGMAAGGGMLETLAGPVAGLLGGGAIGSMFGRGGDAAAAGEAAASGKFNIGQALGGLAGGAGAGGIAQAVLGMIA